MSLSQPMTDVRFYHLTRSRLDDALPVMLQRTLQRQARAVVRFADQAGLQAMDEQLWTFEDAGFLPHGHGENDFAAEQPIWLTLGLDNPASARYLFATDGASIEHFEAYDVCAVLFDGRLEQSVQAARVLWKDIRDRSRQGGQGGQDGQGLQEGQDAAKADGTGHRMTYWQQNERGAWVDKTKKDA